MQELAEEHKTHISGKPSLHTAKTYTKDPNKNRLKRAYRKAAYKQRCCNNPAAAPKLQQLCRLRSVHTIPSNLPPEEPLRQVSTGQHRKALLMTRDADILLM